MSLNLKCDKCSKELTTPGALVFSPPTNMIVEKYHVCVQCWNALKQFISATTRLTSTVYYFGCIGTPGHHLHHPTQGKVPYKEINIIPWGNDIDGELFKGSKHAFVPGALHIQYKDGWTAIAFADYSIDTHPGSHSTFVIKGEVGIDELLEAAKEQWPQVFNRPKFPTPTTIKLP